MNLPARIFSVAAAASCLALVISVEAAAPNKSGTGSGSISLPSGPGSVEGLGGSFEPQLNSGTVNYGVTLPIPAGRAGLTPSIALSYEGGHGNGVCGFGWGVGVGSVRRQSDKGFPRYDSGDTFLFGGEELVPLSNSEQDWRCENDRTFQRMRQVPDRNAWEVTDPNGTRHFYGGYRGEGGRYSAVMNPSARGSDFDRTSTWLLEATIDVHGNRIEYEYEPGDGVLYLSRVTWSHWVRDRKTNYYEARLSYEPRSDVFDDFRSGFLMRTDRRLHQVEMNVATGGVTRLIRSFRFDYQYAPEDLIQPDSDSVDTGVSMLRRVMFFGSDGNTNNYLPPTLFGYTPLKLASSRLQTLDPAPELNLAEERGNVQLIDVDGDGLPDLFQTADFDQRFQLNRGEWPRDGKPPALAFDPVVVHPRASGMQLSNPESTLLDFDGDGLVDYVQLTDSVLGGRELEVFRNASTLARRAASPDGFLDQVETSINLPAGLSFRNPETRQADVNFDKLTDFITTQPGFFGTFILTYRDSDGRWQTLETDYPDDMPPALSFSWSGVSNTPTVFLTDMNGDRIQDIVLVEQDGPSLRTRYWPGVALGVWGKAREVGTVQSEVADLRDVFVQDLTGDGLSDLLMLDGSADSSRIVLRVNVAGDHWSEPVERDGLPRYRPRDDAASTTFRLVDLNGNGSTDLLWVNPGFSPGWQWLELMPEGKANLIRWTDNGIGRVTEITYGTSTEDLVRAREAGYPWQSTTPFAVPVIRRLRITPSLDLDGISDSGRLVSTDQYVTEFQYRDAYYDSFEKEFRGFAYAQKLDYGDDFLMDTNLVTMSPSEGWDQSRTPSGQFGAPSLVTRLHFHTGAPDGVDNDEYAPGFSGARYVDERTPLGGREEEPLKGVQLAQEMVDGWVLHGGASKAGFDEGCFLAATAAKPEDAVRMTPDAFVYARILHEWTVRRLYRSDLPQDFVADNGDGERGYNEVLTPPGRFSARVPSVAALPESGRTVSQVFLRRIDGFQYEANGMFKEALSFPERPPTHSVQTMDQDDFGNEVRHEHFGFVDDDSTDDERFVITRYALQGEAMTRWIIRMPSENLTTDENGVFVNQARHYYDGPDFKGLPLGQIGSRGLESRTEQFINGDAAVPALGLDTDKPGDPRLPAGASLNAARAAFDSSGNLRENLDPLGDPTQPGAGHRMNFTYDSDFNMFCIAEHTVIGNGVPDHVVSATYDSRFGVITQSTNANGHASTWVYDAFARLVAAVKPGDTEKFPTLRYEYLPADPVRNRVYHYDAAGNLTFSAAEKPATRMVSRQREVQGAAGEFVSVAYQDGLMREIALVHEGDFGGHWIVHKANTFTHRSGTETSWLPYDFIAGTDEAIVPGLADFWRNGRPLTEARNGARVVGTRVLSDALGRELLFINAPETAEPGQPLLRRTWRLPREQMVFDEEDTSPTSSHAGTPLTIKLDGLGRVIEQIEAPRLDDEGRHTDATASWSTKYWFDLNDQVVRTRDSQGNEGRFRYDALGRNILVDDPDRGVLSMVYDDASNHTETTDAKGQRILYKHDGHNRLLAIDYLDEADAEFSYHRSPDVEFHYDTVADAVPQGDGSFAMPENVIDKLVWASDTIGAVHFSYDSRGRAKWQVREIDHPAGFGRIPFRMAWEYDSFDRTVRTQFPDNDAYVTEFGSRNLIRSLHGSALTIVSNMEYAVSGKISRITYGNGVVTDMGYDPRLRLSHLHTGARGNQSVVDYQYGYDGLSNVREVRDVRPASVRPSGSLLRNSQVFEYDDLYRLSSASYSHSASGSGLTPDGRIAYRYDRIGNLLEQSASGSAATGNTKSNPGHMAYGGKAGSRNRAGRDSSEPGPHALTAADEPGFAMEYDKNGNVTRMAGARFSWDFEDRLVEADNGTELASYRYSLENVRMSRYVRPKPGMSNSPPSEVVLYPFPGYEVRPGNSAEKLIALPGLLLARIAGSLSDLPRVQRLQLEAGWNLVSIGLAVTNLESQLDSVRTLGTPVLRADSLDGSLAKLGAGPAAYWIHAKERRVVPINGSAPAPIATALPVGGTFLATTAPGRWRLPAEIRDHAEIWRRTATGWTAGAPGLDSPDEGWVEGGEAVFIRLDAPALLPALSGKVAFFHGDHLGSTSIMTDAEGNRIEESTWFPFGGERSRESLTDEPEPYGFTGRENDKETGLTYMTARYQLPEYGRFLSVDPKLAADPKSRLRSPQCLNFYAYARNNPLSWTDPSGCDIELDPQMEAARIDVAQRMHVDSENPTQINGWTPASSDATPSWLPSINLSGSTKLGTIGSVSVSAQWGQFEGGVMVGVWLGNKDIVSFENAISLTRDSKGTEMCGQSGGVIQDAKYVFTLAKACHNFTTGDNTLKVLDFQREPKASYHGNKKLFANGVITVKGNRPQVYFNMKETAMKTSALSGNSSGDYNITAGLQVGGEVSAGLGAGIGAIKPINVSGSLKGVIAVEIRKKGTETNVAVLVRGEGEVKVVLSVPSAGGLVNFPIVFNGKGESRILFSHNSAK